MALNSLHQRSIRSYGKDFLAIWHNAHTPTVLDITRPMNETEDPLRGIRNISKNCPRETGKRLGTRLREHKCGIRRQEGNFHLRMHIIEVNHQFNFTKQEKGASQIKEAWFSKSTSINLRKGLHPICHALRTIITSEINSLQSRPVSKNWNQNGSVVIDIHSTPPPIITRWETSTLRSSITWIHGLSPFHSHVRLAKRPRPSVRDPASETSEGNQLTHPPSSALLVTRHQRRQANAKSTRSIVMICQGAIAHAMAKGC